jgi:hypothetical protein
MLPHPTPSGIYEYLIAAQTPAIDIPQLVMIGGIGFGVIWVIAVIFGGYG